MDCTHDFKSNPVERFVDCFPSVSAAAEAAQISREMLRRYRRLGHVTYRDRAIAMSEACGGRVSPQDLLDLPKQGRAN